MKSQNVNNFLFRNLICCMILITTMFLSINSRVIRKEEAARHQRRLDDGDYAWDEEPDHEHDDYHDEHDDYHHDHEEHHYEDEHDYEHHEEDWEHERI